MKIFSLHRMLLLFLGINVLLCIMPWASMQVWASTTVTPFSLGGKDSGLATQQAQTPPQESVKKVPSAAKPLFVKTEDAKPESEKTPPAAKPLFVKTEDIKTEPEKTSPSVETLPAKVEEAKPLFVKEEHVKPRTEESAPAAKPLFVKEGDIKPEAEKSSASKVEGGATVTSFAIPLAPAPKKPGKAVFIPNEKDVLALTAFISDQQTDTCLRAIALQASPLVAVRLESMGGKLASWKTKDVKASAQGVLALYQGENLVNANDASFSLDVAQPTELDLCVQDSGALKDVQTKFRVIFFHADGTRTYAVVVR